MELAIVKWNWRSRDGIGDREMELAIAGWNWRSRDGIGELHGSQRFAPVK